MSAFPDRSIPPPDNAPAGVKEWIDGTNSSAAIHLAELRRETARHRRIAWTPSLTFATPGDLSLGSYSIRWGEAIFDDRELYVVGAVTVTPTFTTASGALEITGLPRASANIAGQIWAAGSLEFQNVTKAGYTQFTPQVGAGTSFILFGASGSGKSLDFINAADITSGVAILLRFSVRYRW